MFCRTKCLHELQQKQTIHQVKTVINEMPGKLTKSNGGQTCVPSSEETKNFELNIDLFKLKKSFWNIDIILIWVCKIHDFKLTLKSYIIVSDAENEILNLSDEQYKRVWKIKSSLL